MTFTRKRSTVGRFATIAVWAIGLIVCVAVGLAARGRNERAARAKPAVAAAAANEQDAVRQWLKENANTGDWEEVRWWGPVTLHRELQDSIRQDEEEVARLETEARVADQRLNNLVRAGRPSKQQSSDLDTYDSDVTAARQQSELLHDMLDENRASLRFHKGRQPIVLCRLKFRTKNAIGATTLEDVIFESKDGRANPMDTSPYGPVPLVRCPLSGCNIGSRYVAECFADDEHGLRKRADANDSVNATIERIMSK